METLAVEMRDITKIFGGVKANDRIQFCLRAGSIHGLLGENGAGKTTLMNILYGLYRQEEGEILIRGQKQEISSPIKAISLGIGMVHQHFMLARSLTVVENVMLGRKSRKGILLDTRETAEAVSYTHLDNRNRSGNHQQPGRLLSGRPGGDHSQPFEKKSDPVHCRCV